MRTTRNKRILALLTSVLLCLSVVATGLAATISVFAVVGDPLELTITYDPDGGSLSGTLGNSSAVTQVVTNVTHDGASVGSSVRVKLAPSLQQTIDQLDPTRTDYRFLGWKFEDQAVPPADARPKTGDQIPGITVSAALADSGSNTAAVTATAQWAQEFDLTVDKNAVDGNNGTLPAGWDTNANVVFSTDFPTAAFKVIEGDNILEQLPALTGANAKTLTATLGADTYKVTKWVKMDGTDLAATDAVDTADLFVKAYWEKQTLPGSITHSVTLKKGVVPGSSPEEAMETETFPVPEKIENVANNTLLKDVLKDVKEPTAKGYRFTGWHDGANLVDLTATPDRKITRDLDLTAQWIVAPYVASFERGDLPPSIEFEVKKVDASGGNFVLPAAPAGGSVKDTATGLPVKWTFSHWVAKGTEAALNPSASVPAAGDTVFVAIWTQDKAKSVTVKVPANVNDLKVVDANDGELVGVIASIRAYGAGLHTHSTIADLVRALNNDNRVTYASQTKYTVKHVRLKKVVAAASDTLDGANVDPDVLLPENVELAGLVLEEITNPITVRFGSGAGVFSDGSNMISYISKEGAVIDPPTDTPKLAGYQFAFWSYDPAHHPEKDPNTKALNDDGHFEVKANTAMAWFLIPTWRRTGAPTTPGTGVEVTFHTNGGRFSATDTAITRKITVASGTKLNAANAPTGLIPPNTSVLDDNLRFVGWSTSPVSTILVDDTLALTVNQTLYAVYARDITVTLTGTPGFINGTLNNILNRDFHFGSTTQTIMDSFRNVVVAPAGQVFAGLSYTPGGTRIPANQRHYANVALYAVYAEPISVTFHANGGQFGGQSTAVQSVPAGYTLGEVTGNLPTLTAPAGKTFKGWSLNANYAAVGSVVDDSYILTQNGQVLYASYADLVAITFNAAPGIFANNSVTHVANVAQGTRLNTITLPAIVPPSGKALRGWAATAADAANGVLLAEDAELTTTQTLIAVYGAPFLTVVIDISPLKFADGSSTYTLNRVDNGTLLGDLEFPEIPAPEGQRFAGWATSPEKAAAGEFLADDFKIVAGILLFAGFVDDDEDDASSDDDDDDASSDDDDDDASSDDDSSSSSKGGNNSVSVSGGGSSSSRGGVGPKTGDNSMMLIGMIALILAGSGIATGVVVYKKRKEQE